MKKTLLLAVSAILLINYAGAQKLDRKVLYTLKQGETILYGEYMVDFTSANKNYVATVIKKENAGDWYDETNPGHIYYPASFKYYNDWYDYSARSYDIIFNGDRKNFNYGPGYYVSRPEKTISTSSWDDVAYIWRDNQGFYIRFHGLAYGPYENEPFVDDNRDAFLVQHEGDYIFVKDGKEGLLADQGYASMPLTKDRYNEKKYNGSESNNFYYEYASSQVYKLVVNGKTFEVNSEPGLWNFAMSPNGKHWILAGYKCIYVDGRKIEFESDLHRKIYIDNNGNYIFSDGYGFIINGVRKDPPAGSKIIESYEGMYTNMEEYEKLRIRIIDEFAYRYKGEKYVFDGYDFVKKQTPKGKHVYSLNTYGNVTIISGDRRHTLIYGWELPSVTIDGKSYGKAPAITAAWNENTKSFFWNALEGQELVVYEYKP